jgi:hypothetical protein
MDKITDEVMRAATLIRIFGSEDWGRTIAPEDRDALVWMLEVVGDRHAYIRSQAFRDVITAAYQMGRQVGLAEGLVMTAQDLRDLPHSVARPFVF